MSMKLKAEMPCQGCDKPFKVEVFRTLWIEEPANREMIFNDTINVVTCPNCSSKTKLDIPFLCTNVRRGIAIWYEPFHDKDIDKDMVLYAKRFGKNSFYAQAPRIKDWNEFKRKILEMEKQTEKVKPDELITPEMHEEFSGFMNFLSKDKNQTHFAPLAPAFIGVSLASLIALFHMPYGYYTFLRIAVFACCVATAIIGFKRENTKKWAWVSIAIAILFNPIIPVHLDRDDWKIFNVGVAAFFGLLGYKTVQKK
jgi:hypothetical protein